MTEQSFASLWGLSYSDVEYLNRFGVKSQVMIACQLLFFRHHGRFPDDRSELDADVIAYVADQTDAPDDISYAFSSDTARRQRGFILDFLGVHRATTRDRDRLQLWMVEHLGGRFLSLADWIERGYGRPVTWECLFPRQRSWSALFAPRGVILTMLFSHMWVRASHPRLLRNWSVPFLNLWLRRGFSD